MSNAGCNKGTDPNVVNIVPEKKTPKHDFGDLNPKVKPKTSGKSFDTKRNTSIDVLKDVARTHLTNVPLTEGRMVGIVLRKLTDEELAREINSSSYASFGLKEEAIAKLKGYKIRIPEIDAHLPEPETFDTGDSNQSGAHTSIINSHKTYISKSEDCVEPTIGDLVWVEVENNVGFYIEPFLKETSMPVTKPEGERVNGGQSSANGSGLGSTASSFSNAAPDVTLSDNPVPGPLPPQTVPPPVTPFKTHKLVRVKADKFNPEVFKVFGGYGSMKLRDDAAIAYNSLKAEINSLGGIMTTSGGLRYLDGAKKSASRSQTSIHYTGLAFDLCMWTGMHLSDLSDKGYRLKVALYKDTLPYVIERRGSRNWNVWCRTENPNVPMKKLKAYYYPHNEEVTEGRFIDFTATARKYGFTGIGQRKKFQSQYACAEWWHFNYLVPLVKGRDTFASILEEVWSAEQLNGFAGHYKFGSRVWGRRWRG
jgi:hypothetical protein